GRLRPDPGVAAPGGALRFVRVDVQLRRPRRDEQIADEQHRDRDEEQQQQQAAEHRGEPGQHAPDPPQVVAGAELPLEIPVHLQSSASFVSSMTVPTAMATEIAQAIHMRMSRQSRGPRRVVWMTPTAPNSELSTLVLRMNLRTASSSHPVGPRYRP